MTLLHDINVNGVLLAYGVNYEKTDPCGIFSRGSCQDLTPVLAVDVISQITEQIRAARDSNAECQRKDESGPVESPGHSAECPRRVAG